MITKRVLFIVLIVFVIGISTVQAEKPAKAPVKACVGISVSNFIKYIHNPQTIEYIGFKPNLGTGVSLIARDEGFLNGLDGDLINEEPKNLGQAIQLLQSGLITQDVKITIGNLEIENINQFNVCNAQD